MATPKILVIDDEAGIRNLVTAYLEKEDYQVITAGDGPSGLQAARAEAPDLIILDIMLPGMDGIELLQEVRKDSGVYVIMLTAKAEEIDKIIGLQVGADDYLTKPFSPRELVARVKAALRRLKLEAAQNPSKEVAFQRLRIDPDGYRVWVDGQELELTTMEFSLLLELSGHAGMVLSREQLLERVWGTNFYGETRLVDVHVSNLRKKLGLDQLISTVRGVGYRFNKEVA